MGVICSCLLCLFRKVNLAQVLSRYTTKHANMNSQYSLGQWQESAKVDSDDLVYLYDENDGLGIKYCIGYVGTDKKLNHVLSDFRTKLAVEKGYAVDNGRFPVEYNESLFEENERDVIEDYELDNEEEEYYVNRNLMDEFD